MKNQGPARDKAFLPGKQGSITVRRRQYSRLVSLVSLGLTSVSGPYGHGKQVSMHTLGQHLR